MTPDDVREALAVIEAGDPEGDLGSLHDQVTQPESVDVGLQQRSVV